MKVLILINNDVGLYNFRKELIQALIELGHEVHISLPNGEMIRPLVEMGCIYHETPIDRRSINPFKDLALFIIYNKLIKNVKPDRVLSYTIKPNIYGGLACQWHRIPFLPTITGLGTSLQREGFLARLIRRLYKISLKKSRYVLFENTANRLYFVKHRIISDEKTVLLNGAGVNLCEYMFTPLSFHEEKINILFMGRIMKEKGVDELFYAAKQLKKRYPEVHFHLLGFFEDNYKEEINKLISENIITYHGFQKDVKPYIVESHCVVLPSYHEGMSNTLLESAAMGRPLIASDIPGCREAIIDGCSGFLCEVKNKESLLKKLEEFILLPQERKREMGICSREHMEKHFDRQETVSKILKLIIES
jgi:galacturonosyltransferase